MADLERVIEQLRNSLEASQDRERQLAHELQHRVRNMLATIRSVLRQSREAGGSQDEFVEHLQGRLDAIGRHYSGTQGDLHGGIELEDLVRDELLKVLCIEGEAYTVEGGSIRLSGRTLELIGLAIHELTTNALKFGALAGGGKLAVSWTLDATEKGPVAVRLRWIETGVAMVGVAPRQRGFGRQLLEDALAYELGASPVFDLKPGGLSYFLDFSLPTQSLLNTMGDDPMVMRPED